MAAVILIRPMALTDLVQGGHGRREVAFPSLRQVWTAEDHVFKKKMRDGLYGRLIRAGAKPNLALALVQACYPIAGEARLRPPKVAPREASYFTSMVLDKGQASFEDLETWIFGGPQQQAAEAAPSLSAAEDDDTSAAEDDDTSAAEDDDMSERLAAWMESLGDSEDSWLDLLRTQRELRTAALPLLQEETALQMLEGWSETLSEIGRTVQAENEALSECLSELHQEDEDTSAVAYLTGDALGYTGAQQACADLCLAFGFVLKNELVDSGWDVSTELESEVVILAGFLAAAPVVAARFGVDVLRDPCAAEQAQGVLADEGMPVADLLDFLDRGDSRGFLAALAAATGELLAELGVELSTQHLLELPTSFAVAGPFVDHASERAGLA